jgi:hypothetical protein
MSTAVAKMVILFHNAIPSSVEIHENLPDCNMSHPRKQKPSVLNDPVCTSALPET